MRTSELIDYGIPKKVVEIIGGEGYKELYPPQEEAVLHGLLDLKSSFVVSVPTASGKTLIAELLMLKSLLTEGGKCLYIVPLRALANEKYEEFKKYEKIGIKTAISTGEFDSSNSWLANYDIIVTTSEKADSLLRHRSEWLDSVKILVADEVHLIHDASRGPTLEVTIARLMQLNPRLIVLALSATIKNADEIATWLKAKLIKSDWRPVQLKEGVCLDNEIFFNDSKLVEVGDIVEDRVLNPALETVKEGGQSLIFVNTRKRAERSALNAAKAADKFLDVREKEVLKGLAKEALGTLAEPTRICKRLSKCVEHGVAFHHAGLAAKQRKIVEGGFKDNHIKIISATPTLAAGVNLPARRVVVGDYTRYETNLGRIEIPVLEYKQMAGRAGRPKYDACGEALLIAKVFDERSHLLDDYILAEPETIYSKLAIEAALRTHVLSTIATGYVRSFHGVLEFFSRTFFAHQQDIEVLEDTIQRITDFLITEGFVREKGDNIIPTSFGIRVSELYIDPASAVILRDALLKAQKIKTREISYLHAISKTHELGGLFLRKKDYDLCTKEFHENSDSFLHEIPNELLDPWKFEEFLAELKMALFFKDWIEERSEEFLLEKYNLGPGDTRNKVDIADWMMYSLAEVGRLFKLKKIGEINRLRTRVRHGIREELLELVSLKGIGRVRARRLYNHGFKTLEDLRKAEIRRLSRVEFIGRKIAEKIKEQLGERVEAIKEKRKEDEADEVVEVEYQSKLADF